MRFIRAAFGSPEQLDSIELRRRVLRLPLGLDFSLEELAAEDEQVHFVASDESGLVVGVLLLVPKVERLKMRQVAVDPALQGKGIGKALVRACEAWATDEGFQVIEMNARNKAIPFYEALGYTVVGEEFLEVGIPHHRMEKAIHSGA